MKELIAEVSKNDKFLRLKAKSEFYEHPELIHRTASLLLLNTRNELMLQKVPQRGKGALDLYDFSVTATVAGESYATCLERAIKEELGLTIDFSEAYKFFYEDYLGRDFNTVFVSNDLIEPQEITLEDDLIRWIDLTELKKSIIQFPERFDPQFIEGIKIYLDLDK